MAVEVTPPAGDPPTPAPTPAPVTPPEPQGDPTALGDPGKKALDEERKARREAEARLKELEPLAAKAQKLEEAQKTETQKLTEKLTAAESTGNKATGELLNLHVALAKAPIGMDPAKILSLAGRLKGSTRDELEADAEELFADFAATAPPPAPLANGQRPVENLRPGALPTPPQQTLAEQIAVAEAAKDWATARHLKTRQLMELQNKTT